MVLELNLFVPFNRDETGLFLFNWGSFHRGALSLPTVKALFGVNLEGFICYINRFPMPDPGPKILDI